MIAAHMEEAMNKTNTIVFWVGVGLMLVGMVDPAWTAVSGGSLPPAPSGQPRPESAVIMGLPVRLEPRQVDAAVQLEKEVQKSLSKSASTETSIADMAKQFGLFNVPSPNRHLGMLTGDISYWEVQVSRGYIDRDRLAAEFAARKVVLQTAAAKNIYIPSQGDLAAAAHPLVGYFLNQLP